LKTVTSHSLQPYRGCSFGNSLCGVGCYVRHSPWVTRGEVWGSFVEAKVNAAEVYRGQYERERAWARRSRGHFGIFMSSATDPFVPHEDRFGVTAALLAAFLARPPDSLVIQSHTHRVAGPLETYRKLLQRCRLRVHISIESDTDRLPGLPPPASPVELRLQAAAELKAAGVPVVVTVAPLLPMDDPDRFFARLRACADAVVIDHYIGGDGSAGGSRTRRTRLPEAIAAVDPTANDLAYREAVTRIAERHFPGRVGVGAAGFAGDMLDQ
jgi:DNA repair photolyase